MKRCEKCRFWMPHLKVKLQDHFFAPCTILPNGYITQDGYSCNKYDETNRCLTL